MRLMPGRGPYMQLVLHQVHQQGGLRLVLAYAFTIRKVGSGALALVVREAYAIANSVRALAPLNAPVDIAHSVQTTSTSPGFQVETRVAHL
jgi:hypothetical protein